jgi:hypothetical protein
MLLKRIAFLLPRLVLATPLFGLLATPASADDNLLANLNDFDDTPYVDNPWGAVNDGVLTMPPGTQFCVDENGAITPTIFSPSVAVGDLNGDGLPDLVVADAKGYFWFFPNSGTPTQPKFTTGEVMPIWIGVPNPGGSDYADYIGIWSANDNIVPRIQLVDYSNEKKLSIVAGNFEGKLFYIHNIGSAKEPQFSMPQDLANITLDTYSDHHLWCNFLAPFLYDFTGNGQLDLIMGEGTYASNSIYKLVNKGSNGSPIFNEKLTTKIIPGYGREHLTPQVVDWDNDGKPDIIAGERQGYIDLFLNKSTDPSHPVFDDPPPPAPPNHIKFGDTDQLGVLTTVAVGDLTGNHLPNLVISNSDDHLAYALNKGKLGAPEFDLPVPIKGENPFPKVFQPPQNWSINKAFSMPYVLLASTKLKDDPEFISPDGTIKSALKIYTVPHKHTYFPNEVYPVEDTHVVSCNEAIPLQAGVRYTTSFWVRTTGNVENLSYVYFTWREDLEAQGGKGVRGVFLKSDVGGTSSSWTHYTGPTFLEKADRDKDDTANVNFMFGFNGNGGTVSVAGFSLIKTQ